MLSKNTILLSLLALLALTLVAFSDEPTPVMGEEPRNPLFYGSWTQDKYTDKYVWQAGHIIYIHPPSLNMPPEVFTYRILKDYGHSLLLATHTDKPIYGEPKDRIEIHQLTSFEYDGYDHLETDGPKLLKLIIYYCDRPDLTAHLFTWPAEKIIERFKSVNATKPDCRFATDDELTYGGHPAMRSRKEKYYRFMPYSELKSGEYLTYWF